mgnify:CR=1 FL=1
MPDFDAILVLVVIAFILVSLYKEIIGPAFTFMVAIIILGLFGILTPKEILNGFANEQISVILLLLLLGDIIRRASVIELIFDRLFRGSKSKNGFMMRMMMLVGGFSAFLNNTPLVAVMMPYIHNWCKRHNISPSKLLIPLSFAAILGGCATLIGTSTNLIVNGLVVDQSIIPGLKPLGLFDFAWVGVPMIIIGFLYLLLFSNKLLPSKKDVIDEFSDNTRQHILEAQVRKKSHLIGKTIEEAGLRNLRGLYLFEIVRKNQRITAVSPDVILEEEDFLLFTGDTENIADLVDSRSGLTFPEVGMLYRKRHTEIAEIVLTHNSTLINKTVKEANFRSKYDAAILSIHRNGETIRGKIGNIKLKAGDALLLLAGGDLIKNENYIQDFYLISKIKDINRLELYKVIILLGGTALAIALSALGFISLFMALITLLIILLFMKIANPKDLPKNIDYNLAIIIAMSLALGTAMIKTGVAEMIADLIITVFKPLGKVGLLAGIYLITTILAAYITNKASAAIIFPISVTLAINMNLPYMPFILVVAFASAANFMTPIGYQTNLMVYGPGNYSFTDYFRIGAPLTLIYMVVTVIILSLVYF